MDKTSRDAAAAKAVGLSYGQYMALQPPSAPPASSGTDYRGETRKNCTCILCGDFIPRGSKRFKYCSLECEETVRHQRQQARDRARAQRKHDNGGINS